MRVAIAQVNPVVGDVSGNLKIMREVLAEIEKDAADLVVFPELFICGYPPRDLLTLSWVVDRMMHALEDVLALSKERPDLGILVGMVQRNERPFGKGLVNAALLIENGEVLWQQNKQLLPTYDVFDEYRYFDSGNREEYKCFEYKGERLGISICEDAWNDPEFEEIANYSFNPIEILANDGATLMININASPYHLNKDIGRYERNRFHARKWKVPYVSAAQVGGNDELVFDGRSMALDADGHLIELLAHFESDLKIVDMSAKGEHVSYPMLHEMEALRKALVLGTRDYMVKCGFKRAVLGLSGGIDSAVTACVAVEALGAENVRGVTMPSMYSSDGSVADSLMLALNLGIQCDQVPIKPIYESFTTALEQPFAKFEPDVTEENLQARIRGNLLMAYSNKFNALLLTTGNKSELAMGYCTLYGDMDGGLAVLSDVPKIAVYELARWYNRDGEMIPWNTIRKPPSAELRPDQTDQDSLPPYEVLDAILQRYLEKGESPAQIVAAGFDQMVVNRILRTVDANEYKRRQAAPGLRVTPKAFGIGRRMPVAARRS